MGGERAHRLDADVHRPAAAKDEELPETGVPGRRTQVEQLAERLSLSPLLPLQRSSAPGRRTLLEPEGAARAGFEDYRVLGLGDLLQWLGPDHALRAELLAAADRTVGRRAAPSHRSPQAPQAPTPNGHAMWRAAERHAVTLYRHAVDAGEVDEESPALAAALEQRGSGHSLPAELCREMEHELGLSLARVRVHTDSVAAQAALAVRADAFTVGEDIFFAEGAFAPETPAGRKLLAHELAHVAQARRGQTAVSHRGMRFSRPSDSLEHEAEGVAEQVERNLARREKARSTTTDPFGTRALGAQLGERMGRLFGSDLTNVRVHAGSPAASGATKAVTQAGEIHFRDGAYQPGTASGDWLIAHELAHVVQQRGTTGGRAGTRAELEREADRAASRVVRGLPAGIALRASAGEAYAFSEAEPHDDMAIEPTGGDDDAAAGAGAEASHEGAAPADAHGPPEAGAEDASATPADARAAEAKQDDAKQAHGNPAAAEPATEERAAGGEAGRRHAIDGGADEAGADEAPGAEAEDLGAATAEIGAPVAAEDAGGAGAGGGAPGGGGGDGPAKPEKAVPAVAAAKPEAGLSQLAGVRPDKLVPALGQVHTAATGDVGKARAEQRANPPKQLSTGDAAGPKRAAGPDAASKAAAGAPAANGAAPGGAGKADAPVKAEVPGGEAKKQARQSEAAQQQQTAGQMVAEAARSIASWLGSWLGGSAGKRSDDKQQGGMSEAETKQMSGSLDKLPTSAAGIATSPGPAPELAMQGEAQGTADARRAELETETARLEQQGRADSRVPLGEDSIETSVPTEELVARPAPRGAPPAAALPTLEGAAPSEEVGFVAKEQHGAEIDAALAKASADVTAERAKHTQEEAKARADADKQVRDLKTKADADHVAARAKAKGESDKARGEWQAEIDKQGKDARKKADKKVAEGMAQVQAEEAKANAEAKQHIEEGQQKAEEEKQKGEREAEEAKQKGKSKSSGFFGWLSSKAKAFFDGIKKAISAAIDAARKAVKAVIDAAKKLAMAAIDLARKAITAAIKAIGDALIAISDVLLAAFPGLKAKFQAAIRKAVDVATAAVNKIADGLKQAVQAALDLLGAALDKALGLLEKGLHAIVDAAGAVVQGAIKAAQAVVEALGTWAKLIKDVATGPGAWLRKLGAAIVDGIRNHLWAAFKTAVVEWFKSKVFELLGVGGIVLQLLLEGGLTREHIIQMALDALIVAIPAALIAILIEKLVSMIVPAAGALMAIIEGLQAAWGTISRIIAAFAAFMAFLLAVKSGGAGPLFAVALASAAVVLLDFVANWLLKKLASAARKVGAKLKGLAEKFKARRKAKRDAKAARKAKDHDGPDGADPGKRKDDQRTKDEKERKKQEEKDRKNKEILAKAQRELPPKINAALQKKPGKLMFRARLAAWRLQYRLTSLQMIEQGDRFKIRATVNPTADLDGGFIIDVLAMLKRIGDRLMRENPEALQRAAERAEGLGIDPNQAKAQRAFAPETAEERLAVAADQKAKQPNREQRDRTLVHHGTVEDGGHVQSVHEKPGGRGQRVQGDEVVRSVNLDGSASNAKKYTELAAILEDRGITPKKLGEAMRSMSLGRGIPASMKGSEKELGELMGLMFGTEASRDSRNPLFSMMAIEQMERGAPISTTLTQTPAEMGGHVRAAEGNRGDLEGEERTHRHKQPKIDELVKRQMAALEAWFKMQTGGRELVTASVAELEKFVEDMVRRFIRTQMP